MTTKKTHETGSNIMWGGREWMLLIAVVLLGVVVDWATYSRSLEAFEIAGEYQARSGDSLLSLAQEFYGKEEHWIHLYRANEEALVASGILRPGQRLKLPIAPDGTRPRLVRR